VGCLPQKFAALKRFRWLKHGLNRNCDQCFYRGSDSVNNPSWFF